MKNFLVIVLATFSFSLQIANANSSSDELKRCVDVNQGCNDILPKKKFKFVKFQEPLNQSTTSGKILAIITVKNNSPTEISNIKESEEKISNINIANNQPNFLEKNNQLLKTDIQKDLEKNSDIRTKGHIVGFDVVLNRASFNQYYSDPDGGINYEKKVNPPSTGYGGGLGVNYKYAFNFNKFFIAPGIFYEKLNTKVTPSQKAYPFYEVTSRGLTVNDRYGIITNFGYDFNQYISPYLVVGYSAVRYNSKNGIGYVGEEAVETVSKTDTAHSLLYGLGLNLKYNQQVSFNLEFNMQKFTAKQGKISDPVFISYNSKYKADIDSLKLGVAFNF